MNIKRGLTRTAALGAVAGVIALGGVALTGSAAFADAPDCSGVASPTVQYARTLGNDRLAQIIASADPCSGVGSVSRSNVDDSAASTSQYSYQYYGYAQMAPYYPYYPYYTQYAYYNTSSIEFQTQLALIQTAGRVLNVSPDTIAYQLSGGATLSQIAAGQGWTHVAFWNAMVSRVQYDASIGVINATVAGALLAGLNQTPSSIDIASLPVALQGVPFDYLLQML